MFLNFVLMNFVIFDDSYYAVSSQYICKIQFSIPFIPSILYFRDRFSYISLFSFRNIFSLRGENRTSYEAPLSLIMYL